MYKFFILALVTTFVGCANRPMLKLDMTEMEHDRPILLNKSSFLQSQAASPPSSPPFEVVVFSQQSSTPGMSGFNYTTVEWSRFVSQGAAVQAGQSLGSYDGAVDVEVTVYSNYLGDVGGDELRARGVCVRSPGHEH